MLNPPEMGKEYDVIRMPWSIEMSAQGAKIDGEWKFDGATWRAWSRERRTEELQSYMQGEIENTIAAGYDDSAVYL